MWTKPRYDDVSIIQTGVSWTFLCALTKEPKRQAVSEILDLLVHPCEKIKSTEVFYSLSNTRARSRAEVTAICIGTEG